MNMPAPVANGSLTEHVRERLNRALGPDVGERTAREALEHLALDDLRTPNELLAFADYVITQGGVAEAVGRALRVTALLRGAKPPK
jgi:hypothetical protein